MAILVEILERNLFVFPIIEFCSCINIFLFKIFAARIVGMDVYPPKPTTNEGLNFIIK